MAEQLVGTGQPLGTPDHETPPAHGELPKGEWGRSLLRVLGTVVLSLVLAWIGAYLGAYLGGLLGEYIDYQCQGGPTCGLGGLIVGFLVGALLGLVGGILIGIFPRWQAMVLVLVGWVAGVAGAAVAFEVWRVRMN